MRKILATAGATLALGIGSPIAISAITAAPASACTVSYHGIVGAYAGGYASVHMVTDNGCASYHVKVLCKYTPTSGVTEYGPSYNTPGYSRANCPGSSQPATAWAVIAGTAYKYYPQAEMWWMWPLAVAGIAATFAFVYQDWLLPSRRRIGYEAMRRSVRDLKNAEFGPEDDP